jgi:hypothetical protein
MPKRQHLPSVSDKEQRMYEHIKESELEQGRSNKRAKQIAANKWRLIPCTRGNCGAGVVR